MVTVVSLLGLAILALFVLAASPHSSAGHAPANVHSATVSLPKTAPAPGDLFGAEAVGKNPMPPVYDPQTGDIYVANFDGQNLTVVSGSDGDIIGSIAVGPQPISPALDPANGDLYVPTEIQNSVDVVNASTQQLITSIDLPTGLESLPPVYDPVNGQLYVASALENDLTAINASTNKVQAILTLPGVPLVPALDPWNDDLFVPIEGTGTVSIVSGTNDSVVANLTLTAECVGSGTFDPQNGNLYFPEVPFGSTSVRSGAIVVISGAMDSVVTTVPVGDLPQLPVVVSATNSIDVSNYGSANVSILAAGSNQVVATVPVPANPGVPVFDNRTGEVYVASVRGAHLTAFSESTTSISAEWTLGSDPQYGVVDPSTGLVVFSNKASSNVSLLADGLVPIYPVTISETGLPAGSPWSLVVDGIPRNTTGTSLEFSMPSGTYWLAAVGPRDCSPSSAHQVLVVNGQAVSDVLAFPASACQAPPASNLTLYAGVAGVAFVLLILAVAPCQSRRKPARRRKPTSESGTNVPSVTQEFRRSRRRKQLLWALAAVVTLVVILAVYLTAFPTSGPAGAPPGPFANLHVTLGAPSISVADCGGGGSTVVERVPWVNASASLNTAVVSFFLTDDYGDFLSSTGIAPDVNATSVCVGTPPAPIPVAGLGNDFSWYVVLTSSTGVNLAYFTVTTGWVPVGSGSGVPVTLQNGSSLAVVCDPTVSPLGAYNFEGPYLLQVGVTAGGTSTVPAIEEL